MASIDGILTNDVVKSGSLVESVASGVLGGVVNGIAVSALPNIHPLLLAGGEILGGVVLGGMVGGKAGRVLQNAGTVTGSVALSDYIVQWIGGTMGGEKQQANTPAAANPAVIY